MATNDPVVVCQNVAASLEAYTGVRTLPYTPDDIQAILSDLPCSVVSFVSGKPNAFENWDQGLFKFGYLRIRSYYQISDDDTNGITADQQINLLVDKVEKWCARNFSLRGAVDTSTVSGSAVSEQPVETKESGIRAREGAVLVEIVFTR